MSCRGIPVLHSCIFRIESLAFARDSILKIHSCKTGIPRQLMMYCLFSKLSWRSLVCSRAPQFPTSHRPDPTLHRSSTTEDPILLSWGVHGHAVGLVCNGGTLIITEFTNEFCCKSETRQHDVLNYSIPRLSLPVQQL